MFYGSLDTCQPLGEHLPGQGNKKEKKKEGHGYK